MLVRSMVWMPGLMIAMLALVVAPIRTEARPLQRDESNTNLTDFRTSIRPILSRTCLNCHNAREKKGGLDLSTRAAALAGGDGGAGIEPGDLDGSLVIEKLRAGEMPPGNPLPPEQVQAFERWVAAGAAFENEPIEPERQRVGRDWWSLQPIGRPVPPALSGTDRDWARNPIDVFVADGLRQKGLVPAPEADRATLIRRLSFDRIGLPPTFEEIRAFELDPAPDAYERLVDRLLASPTYGERWARHWLDAVRFGESHGYEMNTLRPNAWPYRDYVIRSLNTDTPFERFVGAQLAGDVLPDADFWERSATGFLVGGTHDMVGNLTVEGMRQQRMDDLDDIITATGSAFLGLTVSCARCHDHKFDPIDQRDYYGLQAVFAGVQHAERPIDRTDAETLRARRVDVEDRLARIDAELDAAEPLADPTATEPRRVAVESRRNVERFAPIVARRLRFTIQATTDAEPCLDELEIYTSEPTPRNVALAEAGARVSASSVYAGSPLHKLEHLNDGRHGNARSWISAEPGAGWVEVEFASSATIDRIVWGRDREQKFADRLATRYTIEVASDDGTWRTVAGSSDRAARGMASSSTPVDAAQAALVSERDALREELAGLTPTAPVYAGTFVTPGPTHVLRRGDPMQPGEEVSPSAIAAAGAPLELSPGASESDRRLALAAWIARRDNPLAPRVMVNRLWHHHFGRGIVATPSDFGSQGSRPSHPELLDWLARAFLDAGGQAKPIHRLIVTSATYRQSSETTDAARTADSANEWLGRYPRRRLEAESIRDAMLAVSGSLDRRAGGPGYSLWEKNTNYVVVFVPRSELGPDTFRRMVYQFKPRSQPDPTFGAFDCPDAAMVAPRRTRSTTALQALNLMNSPFVVDQAKRLAERSEREAGLDERAQVERAFLLALGRAPVSRELEAAVALRREHGLPSVARALLNSSEFLWVR